MLKNSTRLTYVAAMSVLPGWDVLISHPTESFVSGEVEDVINIDGQPLTLVVNGESFEFEPHDAVQLPQPVLVAPTETNGLTQADILLLGFLETINGAGGLRRDSNGNVNYQDELENDWPDLAIQAEEALNYFIEKGAGYATLRFTDIDEDEELL